MNPVQLISHTLLDSLTLRAQNSERRRTNHNFHASLEENPNRFLNVMLRDSYFTPHRHTTPPKPESFLVLRGEILSVIFNGQGEITEAHRLGTGGEYGIDVGAGIWHTIIVISETAACFELKAGPYAAASDKEFAPWAPREGTPDCAVYLQNLTTKALALCG